MFVMRDVISKYVFVYIDRGTKFVYLTVVYLSENELIYFRSAINIS